MYSNVLIISDNLEMALFFKELVDSNKCYDGFNFTISISPYSDQREFADVLNTNILVYNLNNKSHIETIISRYSLVLSMHCKQLFPEKMVNTVKCINVHPGYNPINRGWYPQVFAIINDLPIGATIHEIDESLDHGKIIDRGFVEKESHDTSFSLYKKVQELEKHLIKTNLMRILLNEYQSFTPESEGNVFFKRDFHNLCELNLDVNMKVSDTINLLRALTHGNYSNAYFVDKKTKKKIFIKISLTPDD